MLSILAVAPCAALANRVKVRHAWIPCKKNWRLDDDALLMPNGQRIAVRQILQWKADQLNGHHGLTRKWPGWRVRQQWLIAPEVNH